MRKQITLLLIIVIVFLAFYSVYYYSNYRVQHVPVIQHVEELDSTRIVHVLEQGPLSHNLLFTPGLSRAFQGFRDTVPYEVNGIGALSLTDQRFLDSPSRFLVETAGKVSSNTLSHINKLENRRLNNQFEFYPGWKNGEWFVFSHYFYPVLFKNTFQLSANPLKFKGKEVQALISTQKARGNQFRIYRKPDDHLALEYQDQENGKLVIAMPSPRSHLKNTYEAIHQWLSEAEGQPLKADQGILLPMMDFYLTQHKKSKLQAPKDSSSIINACQRISFSINAEYSFLTANPSPASLKFNRPFLVYHIPPDADKPVFMMWVANSEVLMPVN